ncbi:hypothetical protein Mapa_000209 [Marchantia paleacea]|nr:hypothetical protein Mapa_000209 [Marchantia paleacea]
MNRRLWATFDLNEIFSFHNQKLRYYSDQSVVSRKASFLSMMQRRWDYHQCHRDFDCVVSSEQKCKRTCH